MLFCTSCVHYLFLFLLFIDYLIYLLVKYNNLLVGTITSSKASSLNCILY